jgi:hypothetical protein
MPGVKIEKITNSRLGVLEAKEIREASRKKQQQK